MNKIMIDSVSQTFYTYECFFVVFFHSLYDTLQEIRHSNRSKPDRVLPDQVNHAHLLYLSSRLIFYYFGLFFTPLDRL